MMRPDEHKRVRYAAKTRVAAIGAELARDVAAGALPEEAIETFIEGLADGLVTLAGAFLDGPKVFQILQTRADEAGLHIPELR